MTDRDRVRERSIYTETPHDSNTLWGFIEELIDHRVQLAAVQQ